jgi:hypothetical protein
MSQIMGDAGRFDYIGTQEIAAFWLSFVQFFSKASTNLRYLKGMGQSIVENITTISRYYLSNFGQSPEGRTVEDAIAVTLKGSTVIVSRIWAIVMVAVLP